MAVMPFYTRKVFSSRLRLASILFINLTPLIGPFFLHSKDWIYTLKVF